ncbi:MAG TPA: hypothetical protein VJ768_11485, partial [Anaerolineales bacterium]|nr:hypothetical protein [Anaerolineales bacterium]
MVQALTETSSWKALRAHADAVRKLHLRDLFAEDPARGERMAVEATGIYFDYSKHLATGETIRLLAALARERLLSQKIEAMFRGEKINRTEDRAVLHTALRAPAGDVVDMDGVNVVP